MFSIRIVTTDHYQGSPIPGLDVQYADFRASAVKKVPVIRVYGSTPKGQKTCMHVHGVFPYLYVLYDGTQPWDRYLRLFANSLDKAINVAQGHAASEIQHVYKITLVSGIPMYGYHEREQQFLKIYFYNPSIIRRAADLLLGGAVLNKGFQPYESHIPYTLQMFIDYNLYGMNMLNVAAAKFRRRAQDENANPEHRKENRPSDLSSPTSPDGSLQDWLSNSSFSQSQPIWNQETITSDMYLGRDIVRQSTCELEVDVVAADILNRLEVDANVGNNPGLAALWADERQRKRNLGQSSQITPPASQERGHVEISDSDQTLSDRFREIVLHQLPYIDSQPDSMSESSQEDIFPSQTASSVDLHQSQPEDDFEASQSTIILDDEEEEGRAAIVNMDSIHRVVSMSQSFAATPLSQQSDEPPDRSLALLLASLADDSSLPASQAAAGEVNLLEEKDSILLEKPIVPDDETAQRDDAETLEMSQVVWEEGSQDKAEELESKGEELNFDLEGLDTTWNDSQAVDVSDDDEDLKIPQFDGANDEKPIPAKKSKKKRLGTTGPVISGFDKTSPPEQTPQSTPHGPGYNPTPQNMYGHDGNQYSNRDQFPYQGQGYGMGYGEFNFSDQWNPQGPYNDSPVQGYSMQGWDQQSSWSMMNSPNENKQQLVQGGQGLNSPQGHPQHQGNLQHGGQGLNSPQGHPQHGGQGLNSPQGHPQHGGQGLNSPQGHPQHQGHLQHGGQGLNSPQGHPQHGGQGLNSPQGHLQHASHRNLQSPHSMQGSPVLQTSHGGVQSPHGIQSPHDLPSPHGLEPGRSQGSLQTPQGIQHGNSQRNLQSPHGLQQGHSQGSLQMPHGSQQGSSHGNLQSPHGSQHGNSRGSLQSTSKNSQGNLQSPHVLQGHSQGNLQLPYGLPQGNSLGSVQSSSRNLQSAHRGVDSSCSSGGNTASPVLGNQTMGQGAGFQAAVMEPRDSFSALMNDETLSNNLWNFSEFGGISDSDHTLTQGTDVGRQMGSTDQMYFPQSQPNFLSQASQELNSSQGQLSQFSPNQHGMTSTPVGASQNSQGNFNGNLQGVISNSQQTFSEQTGQSGSQVFPNSQIGNSQGNYQGFSDYSQQSGFPQQTFPNAFSGSYSTYQSQTSPKNNAVQSSSGSHFENSASRTSHSSEFETSPESVPPNFSAQSDFITPVKNGTGVPASANRLVNNQSRVSGEINVYNQSQYHMSGGNVTYSGAPKGGHQNTNTSSHPSSMVSSQFSNSHPNYQTGSFSRSLSEPQGGDGPGSSFSPHSYPRSQSGNQYYDSQKHFVNPNWSEPETPNSKNSSQSKTPKRRGPKKKSEDDPTNSVSKKKSSKKSTKKSVPVSPVVTSAPPTVTLGSVLHGSASFQPRGYVTGGGNLLEKLLLANEERDKNESSKQGSQTSVTSSQNSSDTNNLNTAENNSMGPPSVTSRTPPDQSNNLGVLPNENIFDSSPKALPPNSVQQQTSNSDLRHYLSPFREKTPDSDKWPQQSAASNSQGSSLFSLQNLVSNVSQKTQFGHDVRQIATDGRPYTCSEGELRSFFQRNIGPLESMDSEAEPGNSTACEMPIRKPTNVSELIRNKVAQESRKKRSMSVTELPQRERTFSNSSSNGYSPFSNSSSNGYPPVSGMCSPSRGRAMSSSISSNHHSTPTSNQDRTISFNSSGVPPSNAELLVRERSMSISSTSGQLFVPNSDMMSRDGTFHSMDGYSAVGAEFLARERTMSTSSTSSNRTEFTKSLKQKSVNRPSLVRSFSTPASQKNGAPVRKRGRPPKIRPPPVSVQPSKYTYSFTVPTPTYKKIQFLQLKHHVPKEGVKVVHMHPMDARRYSLLKIGREVVKLKKLSEKELEKEKSVEVTSQRKVLKKPLQRRNTVPFVDRKNVYPSYEELRAEVAKSKGGTKLVAEEEKTFSELWCIDDKTSGPQPIEKITLASIIDKAFSAMSADDEGYGQMTTGCDEDDDELKACEDLCPKITSPNEQASDDACTQVVRENQPKQMVRSTKYQDQFFKYLQQATDMPIPVDEKYRKNGHGQTQIKASASKVTRKKKLLKLHKKLPLVIDPDQGELPDPVLKDVSLTEASDGTRTPVQSRTPITGRSPIRNQSTGELYRLFDSDVLDPRIKSSSSDTENSASEGGNTDSQKDSEKEEDSGEDSCSSEVSQAKDETTSKAGVIDMTESQSSSNLQCEAENCENTEGQHCSDQTSHNTSESRPNSPCKNSDTPSVLPHEKVENMEYSSSKSNESCHKLDQSDISEKRQTESSKTVLNLSDVENSLTVQNNYKECVQSPSQESATETGPPSNTGSDLENMLPASDNKRVPEPGETKKACQFEVHMTRSRSSSESSSRRQTNDEKLKTKSSGGSDLEKKRKSVRISRVEKKRKRETQGADYFVMEKFKGCKRMAVQLKRLNISNGTVVKLSQVFSLNTLFQKNGLNRHKTVQVPEMVAHEPFCDNIFEKFRSFHDSKFFGNIVSDDSSKDSTYFQPRKSRLSLSKRSLSLSKRSRPDDNVIEISSSEEEEEAQSKTSGLDLQPVIKNKWGMNKSVICIDKDGDTDDGEMEDGKESCDENSSGRAAKPTPKLVKKKKKLNKSGKIHMAFNGASYRARKRRARSFSGKLMSSLSVLHQATLANLVDNSPSYGELSDDYRTRYDDALYTMSLYSPPALEELEKSPPRAFSPTDLAEVDVSQEKRNVFDDLYKAMMSDEEGRSPVYSPIKMAGPLFVSLNESPVKHVSSLSFGEESNPLNTETKDFDGGLEKDGFSQDSVVNFRQGPDNVEEKPRGDFVNTDRGMFRPSSQTHNLQGSLGEHRSESVQSEKANTSFVFSVTDKIHNSTGSKIGPLHFKRKAVVKLQPLTEREIKRYCLQTACAGKENVPMVRGRDSASPPDLGPPIIPKFGKNSKEESASPPNLVKSDIFIHSEESVSHDSLNGNEKVFREGENSFSKRTCVQGLKHLVFDHNLLTMKGTNGNSLPKSGTDKTPDVESQTNTNDGANKNQERGDVNQAREALSGKRRPSKQGDDKKCFRSLSPTKKRVLKPQQAPPSRLRVEESAHQYGLHTVINKDAYCSKADDVPDKPREVGGRILTLQSNRVSTLMECLTTVNCEGLSALRQILVITDRILPSQTDNQNLMDSITKDQALRCAMLGDRLVTMVPCKLPPSQASVRLWLKKKELYRQQKIQEKSRKQQQKDLQEINTPTEFTKIVTLTPVQQKVKDINMCDIQTPQHRPIAKEVSFNETAEIFNDESVSPVIQTGESSKEEITPHHSEKLLTSQDSDENMISPSPPQETVCSFRKDEDDIISPSPPKLTMRSVRRDSHQAGKTPTSRMRLDQLSSATLSKKQSCDAVRRTLIGSAHSTPVSMCSQTSLLGDVNVTPIQGVLDKDETTSKGAEGSGVFLTPRRVPLPGKQSLGKGDSRRSLMSSGEMKEMATPANSKGNVSQIDGPTPKNSFGFKVSQHNLQDAKAMHEVQNLTLMSLELHAETRRDLMPDPEIDPILAVFYNILNDVATDDKKCDISGVILVDRKSKECQAAMKNRKKSNQPSSPQPSTSHDTGSKVTSSPQPSTSYQNPPSPQASTSRDPGPSLKGKRPRSRSPSPMPEAKVQRANDPPEIEATLLQKSGVDDDLEVTYVENEQELFQEVLKLFSKWDPDILIGFEIQKLSWGYLLQRASHLSVNLCAQMSRIPDEKKKSSFKAESDEWGADHSSEIHIAGRVILNLWRILRHEVTLNIYTFENVTHHVVHQRVPHFSFQTLNSWLRHRTHLYRWRFIKYYLTRVQGNLKIVDQLDLIGRTSEFARVFGIEFYHVLSRGSQYRVESMMLRLAKPMNFIPSSPSVQQRARMRAPECIALTLEPESRFYADPVVVLDFQSLYPSIMIAHNYCFSTCVGRLDFLENAHEGPIEFGCTHLRISPKTLNRIKNDVTVSPNGVVFVKEHVRKGIISKMVEEILNTRIMVKKSMKEHKDDKGLYRLLDARQLGLKLIANVTYGYTGANFSGRMPCIEVGDSIVRKARETLERALKLVEDRPDWGARVVYGDTDSMFIEMKGRSKEEAFRIGHEICDAVTAMNPKPIKLKFEKVYYPCVLQTKKRYVGYSYETVDQKEPVFDAKGIETVRRDSCPAVSKILERSIKILFGCKDVSKVKEYLLRQCRKFMEGKVTMQDCVFAKEYRGMKSYKPGSCVPALEIAKKLLRQDRRAEPRTGERVPYVIIYGSPGLPLIQLVRQPHELLADPSLRLNATYYITKQILPPLDRLFSLLGVDVFSWYNDMPKVVRIVPNTLLAPDQRKGTISQYFSATNCPVCDQQTNQAICNICIKDPQNVCVSLCDRIRRWEKVYHDLVQVCNTCMGASDDNQPCVSLDCPIMFRRVLAKQDVQKGTQLREVINKVLDF